MKKQIYLVVIVIFISFMGLVCTYMSNEQGMTLTSYFASMMPRSKSEQKWIYDNISVSYGDVNGSPPLSYVIEESNQYKGMFIDYINTLSVETGININIKRIDKCKIKCNLDNKNIDLVRTYKSPDYSDEYRYSNPIYTVKGVMVVKSDNKDIKNVYHLSGKKVAIEKGDYSKEFLKQKCSDVELVEVETLYDGIELIMNNQVDCVVGDEPVSSFFIKEGDYMEELKIAGDPIYDKQIRFAALKENEELISIINKGILKLKKNDMIGKVEQKWLGVSSQNSFNQEDKLNVIWYILIIIIIFLAVIYLFFVVNNYFKKIIKKKTEELNHSKSELQAAFDVLNRLVIIVNHEGKISNVNKHFCEFTKMSKEEAMTLRIYNISTMFELIWNKIKINNYKEMDFEINDKKKYYAVYIKDIDEADDNSYKLITIKDITKDKLAKLQMMQSNKMAAVGQLAAGVAHEIRNPLGIIRNYSYLLKNKRYDDATYLKCLDNIESSVERASGIIDNLLNFSSISGNENKTINMSEFFESILQLENKRLEENNIKVILYCKGIFINTNEEALKHIFINLVNNAIDSMNKGGSIMIFCSEIGDILEIYVSDTGSGIKEEDIENLFNPFFTTKEPGKGTGLGLYITYNEVKKLGGNIYVASSEMDKGTTFKVEIPTKGELM